MRRRIQTGVFLLFCLSAACTVDTYAVDVAFWAPYRVDADTYGLFTLDRKDLADTQGTAAFQSIETVGEVAFEADGKFGGAIRLGGRGAIRAVPSKIFAGGHLAVEAWVKLDRYPAKEACVVFRPATVVPGKPYDPQVDTTKGFALLVDAEGRLHLETTNCVGKHARRSSSPAGAVPLGRWVHLAGVNDQFPISFCRLYVDGKAVFEKTVEYGEGLMVGGDDERSPGPLYLGNNERGDAGWDGWIDQVRIHTKIAKFWPREDDRPAVVAGDPVPVGPPYFLASHQPIVYLPLDGDTRDRIDRVPELTVQAGEDSFVPGVRGEALRGPLTLTAPGLLNLRQGTLEFWLQPVGVNNFADNNRNFVAGPFTLYFLNDGGGLSFKPMTLYFPTPVGLHFLYDDLATEFHPGAWYHIAVTWQGKRITLYVNGRQAGQTQGRRLASVENNGTCNSVQLSPQEPIGIIDEVRLYDKAILPAEAANAYSRLRDPVKLTRNVAARALDLAVCYFPGQSEIVFSCTPDRVPEPGSRIRLRLVDSQKKVLLQEEVPFSEADQRRKIPDLGDGTYQLSADLVQPDGAVAPGETVSLVRKRFVWEGNRLGITDEVFPPFEPIRTAGAEVRVVGRTYTMNGFGLWDHAVSLGRELLAGPIGLRYTTADGEASWSKTEGRWSSTQPKAATFQAEATAAAVNVRTTSTMEIDGCMEVRLELAPGNHPTEIRKLWIEIPLRASEVPLMHTIGDGLRQNHAGRTPTGTGVVWDGSKAARAGPWRNCFTPYIWLGAEERGLAWFGENDKGWVTEKQKSKTPTHELVREAERVVLRIYLINRPVTLAAPQQVRFGLQVSPTKPLPGDWRRSLPDIPGGLAVVPFGGLQCASQGPLRDDWQIADKILECRGGQALDEVWLSQYVQQHRPPLVHGTWDWQSSVRHFAGRAKDIGPHRPLTVYQEEMAAATPRPEFAVFQDEWLAHPEASARVVPDPAVLDQGYSSLGRPADVTFGSSYRDFGCWFADQWLRRGVSLYWDNTFPHLSTNIHTTDAYLAEDGQVQPCLILWNQRQYHQRVWHLLQEWRRCRPEPLEWVLHMTNTLVLPIHTWGTADLDHELSRDEPFAPDWLRTETTGRQIGNLPLSLYAVVGSENRVLRRLAETLPKRDVDLIRDRAEWGMRVVHEIQHSGPLDKLLTDFGYGTDRVVVHPYWAESPVLSVRPEQVKWLVLSSPSQQRLLVVLASWSAEKTAAELRLDAKSLGFAVAGAKVLDAETGETIAAALGDALPLELPGPYGVRLLVFDHAT